MTSAPLLFSKRLSSLSALANSNSPAATLSNVSSTAAVYAFHVVHEEISAKNQGSDGRLICPYVADPIRFRTPSIMLLCSKYKT